MPEEKEVNPKVDFIKWFSELSKNSGKIGGGKAANLAEIYNMKISVPPGFVITAQAYDYFIKKAGLNEELKEITARISYEDTDQLNESSKKARDLIEKAPFPKEMEEEIIEAYETLSTDESHLKDKSAHYLLKKSTEPVFVAVRSSATTEDLADASFAGQQDSFLNIKGNSELIKHVKKCFSSLFTPRAMFYRNRKGFKYEESSLAVIVQRMIDSDKSGVIFSKDPSTKNDNIIIEAVWGLGEGIVSGRISPDRHIVSKENGEFEIKESEVGDKKIAITRDSAGNKTVVKLKEEISKKQVLKESEIKKLAEIALKLEEHYKNPQDIEFATDKENIYIVQTRPITTMGSRAEVGAGTDIKGEVILKGLAASPGIGSGKVKIISNLKDLGKINKGDILVTKMTNPDMVVIMQKSAAIVTDEGGLTAHAAIVSREMGIPAIVGTQEATKKLKEGEIITVNGFTGKIYKGKVSENVQKEVLPVNIKTKTNLKVILDLPTFAQRAAKTNLDSVGLARLEGIIAESGKHPKYFEEKNAMKDYEDIIFKGIKEIGKYFREIWVRTSDIRSDEFSNLKGSPKIPEANPMLGMHGIRYGIKYPEILKSELRAMKKVAKEGRKIGILAPQIISVDEIKLLKEYLKDIEFNDAKIGVMIETPAAVQIIKELCEEGIDFISFGTNDLTQYTLAVDRGNQQVQGIYNELHPSILRQIEKVIKVCKEKGVETSICGQAGSNKEMVKFLVEKEIDSISVNADMAQDIAKYISELEGKTGNSEFPIEESEPKALPPEIHERPDSTEEFEESKEETTVLENKKEEFPVIRGAESEKYEKEEFEEEKSEEKEEFYESGPIEKISDEKPNIIENNPESEESSEKEKENSEENKTEILDIF